MRAMDGAHAFLRLVDGKRHACDAPAMISWEEVKAEALRRIGK
jgi:hypothetical protein